MKYTMAMGSRGKAMHVVAIAALPITLAACGEVEDYSMPDQQTLIDDSHYMGKLYEEKVQNSETPEMKIDLSDERQYRFVLHRLLAGGNTPDNAPELFAQFKDARARAVKDDVEEYERPPIKGGEYIGEAEQALLAVPCKHFIHMDEFTNNVENRFRPVAISSCYSGVQHTYTDLTAFKDNLDETAPEVLGAATPQQAFASPYNFVVKHSEPDPGKPGLGIGAQGDPYTLFIAESLSAVTDNANNQNFTYVTIKTVGADVPWALTPKYQQINDVYKAPPPGAPLAPCKAAGTCILQMEHPRNIVDAATSYFPDDDARIRVCIDRGYANNDRDCDYLPVRKNADGTFSNFPSSPTGMAATDASKPGVVADPNAYWQGLPQYYTNSQYMPYKGQYKLYHPDPNCRIQAYDTARTQALFVLAETGGFCQSGVVGDVQNVDLEKAFPAPGPNDTASAFNLLARYGTCGGSHPKIIEAYVTVYTTATGPAKCGNRYASVKVTPIDFKKSCFAEGTLVRRADGALLPVERFGPGDRVTSNADGTTLTITAVAHGAENEPLVNLFDEDGHDLLLTKTHPVFTPNRGVVQAEALQAGDTVMTESGIKTLVHVSRIDYGRQVYNFALGTAEELAKVGNDGRTMFADGFMVGDNEMQFEVERTVAAAAIVRTMPKAWQVDYNNALARGMVASAPPVE